MQDLAHLPSGITYTQAAMLLAVAAWALRALAHPERPIEKGRLLPLWLVLLWALLLATSFTPYSRAEGFKETFRWAEAFLVWLIAVNTVKRPCGAAHGTYIVFTPWSGQLARGVCARMRVVNCIVSRCLQVRSGAQS